MQPTYGFNTQPHPNFSPHNYFPQGPTTVAPNIYDSLDDQNTFDPFGFQTPSSQRADDDEDEDDEEFVAETQEQYHDEDEGHHQEEPANEPRGKSGKAKRENWTPIQEEALAKAWVHCTLDKRKGNQQKKNSFWGKILKHFNNTIGGSSRTHHQVRSKMITMHGKLKLFNGFYQQADRLRPSGSDDSWVLKQAFKDYKEKERHEFAHMAAWEVVRSQEKYSQVPLLGEDESSGSSSKRKSSDSGNYHPDTPNAEFTSGHQTIPDMNVDPSPRRQKRRDKKTKAAPSSSDDPRDITTKFEEYRAMKKELMDIKRVREEKYLALAEKQDENMRQAKFDKDLKTYNRPHDNVPPAMLEITLARKREIAEKYGWPCDF